MQILNITKLIQHYQGTDGDMHGVADTSHYTGLSPPTVKALTTRAEQLGWITKQVEPDSGYAVTDRGADLILWSQHGEARHYF